MKNEHGGHIAYHSPRYTTCNDGLDRSWTDGLFSWGVKWVRTHVFQHSSQSISALVPLLDM